MEDSGAARTFTTDDPVGLCRHIEATGRFRRDSWLGRLFHPGKVSYRESVPKGSLHIVVDGNRVSVHKDRHSPLNFDDSTGFHYSFSRTVAHNLSGMAEDFVGLLRGMAGNDSQVSSFEPIEVDDQVIDELLVATSEASAGPGVLVRASAEQEDGRRVRFNVIDEAVHLLDTAEAPWSIQLEVRVAGTLDETRLRAAFTEALGRYPMARARKAPTRHTSHRFEWEIPSEVDVDPLRVIECPDDAALEAARADLQSLGVPLGESPPLRGRLARNPGGDVLMLNFNHAATDGVGAVRILQSISRAYRGVDDPLPRCDTLGDGRLPLRLAKADTSTRLRRLLALAEKLRDLLAPPARLTPDGATDEPGYGIHHVRLDGEETRALISMERPGTVNDVLVAALHSAVDVWNTQHGTPCRRVSVLVPANLRPPLFREDMVGNFSLPARIFTNREDRTSPAGTLWAVTAQTRRKKRSGMGTALLQFLDQSWMLPLWAKRASIALLPLTGNRLIDTSLLSNLGPLDDPPSFGAEAGKTTEMWFSAPARMPLGVSIGAITVAGCLHLAFRYRRGQFGPAAAHKFADVYLAELGRLIRAGAATGQNPRAAVGR